MAGRLMQDSDSRMVMTGQFSVSVFSLDFYQPLPGGLFVSNTSSLCPSPHPQFSFFQMLTIIIIICMLSLDGLDKVGDKF